MDMLLKPNQVCFRDKILIQIQLRFTPITCYSAPEHLIAAFRTDIAGFFIVNKFFGTDLSPIRDGPQNDLFADSHGKVLDMLTRKFIALMASGVALFPSAVPDSTLSAIDKRFIRQAAAALHIIYGKVFAIGEFAFAGNLSPVKINQPLLEFEIIIAVRDIDGTDPAIKTARSNKIWIYRHISFLPSLIFFGCKRITSRNSGGAQPRSAGFLGHALLCVEALIRQGFSKIENIPQFSCNRSIDP